jgi:hypothetical protein
VSSGARQSEESAVGGRARPAWLWLRHTLAARKWIVWVIAVVALAAAFQIAVLLLPHNALHSLRSVEEKANGVQELPHEARRAATTPAR